MNLYTDRKVHSPLAEIFGHGTPANAHAWRWSIEGGTAGVAAQRAAHISIYGDEPDVADIARIPEGAWDPATPELGRQHGIRWIRMRDLHHNATGEKPVAAVLTRGSSVFLNITLSSTLKHIYREDGDDLNGVTTLYLAMLNHFPTLRRICWADDVTRAGRDKVDWSQITGKCKVRDIAMVFGGQSYDQRNPGDELALGALGLVGGNDDPMRRRKLTGKRLMKYKLGGAAIAERQMPHGWHHKKDHHGRAVNDGERGLVPEADATLLPVVQALYEAHASGETYQQLAERMVTFEAEGVLKRRDHCNLDNTYAAAADDGNAMYDAAKSFFVRTSFVPKQAPGPDMVARYLAGEDPIELFDADTRLYIAKVELVRTGRNFRRLTNDIRGRGIVLDGIKATYRDDLDEYGWFDVLSAPWAWPITDNGEEVPRFGLSDETCRRVAARLLSELRGPKKPTGGRAHLAQTRRAIQGIGNWVTEPGAPGAVYDDEPTEWGVEARQNNSGRANFVLLFRRESASESGRRSGWSNLGPGERKPDHIAATAALDELTASVAVHLDRQVRKLLDSGAVATLSTVEPKTPVPGPTGRWKSQLAVAEADIEHLEAEARGHRCMAAMMAAAGDEEEAKQYASQAAETAARRRALADDVESLRQKIVAHPSNGSAVARDETGDVSYAAYLVAGLEHASRNNGEGPARLGLLCDEKLVDWRFIVNEGNVTWSCTAMVPLTSGGEARLPLAGVIRNVRTRAGKALANTETVARYVFEEGRDLSSVAELLQTTRKTLLVKRVMPWLVENGVQSRGAKCALVDHPLGSIRSAVHRLLGEDATGATGTAYLARLEATYLDSRLQWGDAAVPDDTAWISAVMRLLTTDADTDTRKYGLRVEDVAAAVGKIPQDVRELVRPQHRSGGFTRPRYLVYANKSKTRVKAIGCPHGTCKARRFASHVVLLPEVAASGFGVICPRCRRTPSTEGSWPVTQFPAEYLSSWTKRGPGGSLREECQTVTLPGDAWG